MHEFSLVRALLKQVDSLRREHAAERVVAINVSVGEFSGIELELFRSAYQTLVEDTPMGDVELQLNCVALQSRCDRCEHQFSVQRFRFECPACHSRHVTVTHGQELYLESVTLEQEEQVSP